MYAYLDHYRKTEKLLPKHISPTFGCFFYPMMMQIDIWEIIMFLVGRILESLPSVMFRLGHDQKECFFWRWNHLPLTKHIIYSFFSSNCFGFVLWGYIIMWSAIYCLKLMSNWSEHIEHLIQAYELSFYGTKTYRWKLKFKKLTDARCQDIWDDGDSIRYRIKKKRYGIDGWKVKDSVREVVWFM